MSSSCPFDIPETIQQEETIFSFVIEPEYLNHFIIWTDKTFSYALLKTDHSVWMKGPLEIPSLFTRHQTSLGYSFHFGGSFGRYIPFFKGLDKELDSIKLYDEKITPLVDFLLQSKLRFFKLTDVSRPYYEKKISTLKDETKSEKEQRAKNYVDNTRFFKLWFDERTLEINAINSFIPIGIQLSKDHSVFMYYDSFTYASTGIYSNITTDKISVGKYRFKVYNTFISSMEKNFQLYFGDSSLILGDDCFSRFPELFNLYEMSGT